ncbi:MAG: GGDEF domain-containing protein [Candidatus Diapherotrites archaeon]|nr:GGDEF domain-containing protein [Candidatus Diapherotrites archaeon]
MRIRQLSRGPRKKLPKGIMDEKFPFVLRDNELVRMARPFLRRRGAHSLVMLDIDNFKKFNDIRGHFMGDRVIELYTRTMAEIARKHGALASRFGGEEFRIFLPMDAKRAEGVIAEFNEALRRNFIANGKKFYKVSFPTFSAGIADAETVRRLQAAEINKPLKDRRGYKISKFSEIVKGSPKTIYDMMAEAADNALYHSKEAGRNRATIFGERTLSKRVVGAPFTPENVHLIGKETRAHVGKHAIYAGGRRKEMRRIPFTRGKTAAQAAGAVNARIFSLGLMNELGLRNAAQKIAFERLLFRRKNYSIDSIARGLAGTMTKDGALRELIKAEKILGSRKLEIDLYKYRPARERQDLKLRAFYPYFEESVKNIRNARRIVNRLPDRAYKKVRIF